MTRKGYFGATIRKNSIKKNEIEGFLDLELVISKEAVMEYWDFSNDKIVFEYLPASELFTEKAMKSAEMVPVTDDHPWGLVDKYNYKDHMKGITGSDVRNEDGFLVVSARIFDEDLQAYILSGKKSECSIGYGCKEDWTPGDFNGKEYDLVQREININHVAMCREGRGGSDLTAKFNSKDEMKKEGITYKANSREVTMKVKMNGKEYDVSETVGAEVEKLNSKIGDLEGEKAGLLSEKNNFEGKLEAEKINSKNFETKATKLEEKVNSYEEKEKEEKLNSLKEEATEMIGEEVVKEKKNAIEIMEAVIKKANGEYSAEGKAEETVRATYEGVIAGLKANGWDSGSLDLEGKHKHNAAPLELNVWEGIK